MERAITYTATGAPDVLTLTDMDRPTPGAGQVLVRIEAAGVNPLDAKLRSGLRPSPPITEPRRIGFDGAGVVDEVGTDVTNVAVGDRVAVRDTVGTYASVLIVDAHNLTVLPDSVSAAQAAALGIPAGTAYQCVRSLEVGDGDTLLVHGGAGAVGQAVIQFAVDAGATVIATASPARHAQLEDLGAIPVAYGDGLTERVREAAPQGVTVALDCFGSDEAIETSLELVSDKNRIATIVRGPDAAAFGIRAFSGGSPIPLTDQELAWRAEAVPVAVGLIDAGKFVVELAPELPLSAAAHAHELIEASAAGGKITLVP